MRYLNGENWDDEKKKNEKGRRETGEKRVERERRRERREGGERRTPRHSAVRKMAPTLKEERILSKINDKGIFG